MKRLIILLLLVLPLGAFAQNDAKIAFVKADEVFMSMPELKDVESKMAEIKSKYEAEFKQMQDEYNKKFQDYSAQQDSLTQNIKLKRMQEIQDIEERMQNFTQIAKQDIDKEQTDLIAPVQKKLQDAIKAVGDEKGYTYIINPAALLYTGSNAVDATPFVKAKLGLK